MNPDPVSAHAAEGWDTYGAGSKEMTSSGSVTETNAKRTEEARHRSIAEHASGAKAWWDSGRIY
jgi:hypothetical protein